jgi:adenylate cyclase
MHPARCASPAGGDHDRRIHFLLARRAPEPTQALAADLATQRYAVWFDSRMLPMEVFWKVIQEKIRLAKAVIVIWSKPSITSEWVYSEAKLGHDLKKLICVRTPDVSPADVPLPFNGYNLSLVSERAKI